MSNHDVADSTDWLTTPLSALSALENALRCQVCKDFYETPMITSCSHTFCSLCIRRALSAEGKCPLCRAGEQEIKLRSNWSMEEAVESFKKARPAVLELARSVNEIANRSPKRKLDETENQAAPETKRLRSSARLSQNKSQPVPSYAPEPEEVVIQASDDDEDFEPEPDDGLVPCPMCSKRMKEWQVFNHIESCTGPTPEKKSPERSAISQLGSLQRQHQKTLDRLPALSYSMLKDNALRKKMAELGISNSGPRLLLEKRHKEWVTLWNANCDAARPKGRLELLRDLDMWERTQGGRAATTGKAAQSAAMIKDKDFDGSAWAAKHDTSFKDLIANARKSSAQAKRKPEPEAPPEEASADRTTAQVPTLPESGSDGEAQMAPAAPSELPSEPMAVDGMDAMGTAAPVSAEQHPGTSGEPKEQPGPSPSEPVYTS